MIRKTCRICDRKFSTGTKKLRIRWRDNPVCRDCDNYIIENFNHNGNHLSEYIDKEEYASKSKYINKASIIMS